MSQSNACLLCSQQLLRHARRGMIYWFCSHCRQEMPDGTMMQQSLPQTVEQIPGTAQ